MDKARPGEYPDFVRLKEAVSLKIALKALGEAASLSFVGGLFRGCVEVRIERVGKRKLYKAYADEKRKLYKAYADETICAPGCVYVSRGNITFDATKDVYRAAIEMIACEDGKLSVGFDGEGRVDLIWKK